MTVQMLNRILRDAGYIGCVPEGATVTELMFPKHMMKAEWEPFPDAIYELTFDGDKAESRYCLSRDAEEQWSNPVEVTKLPDYAALGKRLGDAESLKEEASEINTELFHRTAYAVRVQMYKEMLTAAKTSSALNVIFLLFSFDRFLNLEDWIDLRELLASRREALENECI